MINHRRTGIFGTLTIFAVVSWGISFTAPSVSPAEIARKKFETADDLESLRLALAGYVGTMGSEPRELRDLWSKGSQPEFAFSITHNVGAGWIGPYVSDDITARIASRHKDSFGNDLKYLSTDIATRIQSAGPDGIMDNSDDIVSVTPAAQLFASVAGSVFRSGRPAAGVDVILNAPRNGVPAQFFAQTDETGSYSFSNVPIGYRSIRVSNRANQPPRLVSVHVQAGLNTVRAILLAGTR